MFKGPIKALAAIAVTAVLGNHQAAAQTPAEFFAGKTVQFMVGYPPSGGFDAYTRVAARFIGKHIPGNPTVIVVNKPGASSLTFVQYLATIAPKDGTQFGMFNRGLIPTSVLDPKTNVDFSQFTWIGSMSGEMAVCYMWAGKGLDTFEKVKKAEKDSVTLGDTSKNSGGYIYTSILRTLSPGSTKLVLGYPTTGDIWLAIERGELSGNCTLLSSIQSQRSEWIAQKKIDILIQFDETRHKELPNVPTIYELLPSENMKKAINFLTAAESIGRPVIAPPGLAADRTAALRNAFMDTMKDPELLAFAANAKMGIDPIPGDKAAEIVASIRNTSPEALRLARQLME
jgi:tripartite-type tricarboxylate transporter receptor subunit TctC